MLLLAVDTTTLSGSVALLENSRLLSEVNFDTPATHSRRLLPAIDFLLKNSDLEIQKIEGYAVAVGPGSFTGIRIGLSTIKSLASASGRPVAAVSTLQALALKLRHPQTKLICPLIDAKKGEIYAALFESAGLKLEEIIPQGAYSPDGFFSRLPAHRIIYFIGTGLEVYKDKLLQALKDKARFARRSLFVACEVGLLGYDILKSGKGRDSRELEPLYFRKSQAEEKH
jgi:tRNA threonylcarbamoyladenosine biosynthesis protein TsaB